MYSVLGIAVQLNWYQLKETKDEMLSLSSITYRHKRKAIEFN